MKSNLWDMNHNSARDPIQDTGQQIQSLSVSVPLHTYKMELRIGCTSPGCCED